MISGVCEGETFCQKTFKKKITSFAAKALGMVSVLYQKQNLTVILLSGHKEGPLYCIQQKTN